MYQRRGKYDLAETYATQALAGRRHALGAQHPDTMASEADLALAYLSQGKFAESEPLAREALEAEKKIQPDNWQRYRAASLLGASLAGEKRYAGAEPLLVEGYQGMLARKDRIAVHHRISENAHARRDRNGIAAQRGIASRGLAANGLCTPVTRNTRRRPADIGPLDPKRPAQM